MSATYRVGEYYTDLSNPAAPVVYRCMAAGDKTSSVWAQVSGAPAGAGFNYRGAWNATTTYNPNDAVLLGSGTSSGLFLSVIPANNNAPDSGIGWVQLCSYATWL
jgi:hypothetical protein